MSRDREGGWDMERISGSLYSLMPDFQRIMILKRRSAKRLPLSSPHDSGDWHSGILIGLFCGDAEARYINGANMHTMSIAGHSEWVGMDLRVWGGCGVNHLLCWCLSVRKNALPDLNEGIQVYFGSFSPAQSFRARSCQPHSRAACQLGTQFGFLILKDTFWHAKMTWVGTS